ncbi:MAG TPA: PASTA domain-containing protein, partial [Hanamia sp.]
EPIQIPVPDLMGLTVDQARNLLQDKGIILAAILATGNVTDTANAYIYKQNPGVDDYTNNPAFIQPGQTMDIWIQVEKPVIDTTRTDTLQIKK